MKSTSWRRWSAIGFLALTACNGGTSTSDLTPGAGGNAAESAFAEAGQASLNDEQLDRLLDALENELQTQESSRR